MFKINVILGYPLGNDTAHTERSKSDERGDRPDLKTVL